MGLNYLNIIAIANTCVFILLMIFIKKNKNILYLNFILITLPVLSLKVFYGINSFVIISIIFLLFFYKTDQKKEKKQLIYRVNSVVLIISIIIGLMTSKFSVDVENYLELANVFFILIFSMIFIEECLQKKMLFYTFINSLKITLGISFVFLILQFIFGIHFSLSNNLNPNIISSEGYRYPSFFSDPQVYAQYLGALSFICLVPIARNQNIRLLNYILIMFCALGILTTGGRSGLIGFLIGIGFIFFFIKWKYKIKLIIISIISLAIILNYQNKLLILNRGTDLEDAYYFRNSIWNDAYKIFLKKPSFGIGIGNYAKYVSIHNPDQVWLRGNEYVTFDHPESGYLKYLTEIGFIGFLCFLIFILTPIINGIVSFFKKKELTPVLLIASIICWMIGFYSTYSFGDIKLCILITAILSLLIVYPKIPKQNIYYNS